MSLKKVVFIIKITLGLVVAVGTLLGLIIGPVEVVGGFRLLVVALVLGAVYNFLRVVTEPKLSDRVSGLFGALAWLVLAWGVHTGRLVLGIVGFFGLTLVGIVVALFAPYLSIMQGRS